MVVNDAKSAKAAIIAESAPQSINEGKGKRFSLSCCLFFFLHDLFYKMNDHIKNNFCYFFYGLRATQHPAQMKTDFIIDSDKCFTHLILR